MPADQCKVCGPPEICSRCLKPFPHTAAECDEANELVQLHTIEAFGVTIPIRIELHEIGRPKLRDLGGPNYWRVEVGVNNGYGTAGSSFETSNPGVPRVIEETKLQHEAERAYRAKKDND